MGGLPGAVERDDNRQSDSDFSSSDGNDEKHQNLPIVVRQAVVHVIPRKPDQRKLAASSISSNAMKKTITFRRRRTPANPMANNRPLAIR